ncbi:hypothetical protein [Actinoplanes sp. NPDC023714]|uniref:hypothetical protein n=1 Tax=Actinoplanes sp. NPDC023714 TaxID=3154322 RepID=UPI0033F2A2BD
MDLWPLYPGNDYAALGCLFGVRNWPGWEPIAAGRGLPEDVSDAVRTEYEKTARLGEAIHGSTWVSWPELRDLDMTVTPRARGVLEVSPRPHGPRWQYRVDDQWPDDVVTAYGRPPLGSSPIDAPYGTWQQEATSFEYRQLSRQDVLGPGTGWEHVVAVMRALAHRFGEDGVRLVAWFD